MARRIKRRKIVSRPGRAKAVAARPEQNLPLASARSATRVLIAAPGPMTTVLSSKISSSEDVKLAGVAGDDMAAVEKVLTADADVAAIYVHLGEELAGLDIARKVAKACPEAGILVIVDEIDGLDLRRHARMFGVSWSYTLSSTVQSGSRFAELVQSSGRGIQWIDPELKPVLEAVWRAAEDGRDLEATRTAQKMSLGAAMDGVDDGGGPTPGQVQTLRTGNSGVGHSGFGVNKAG